METLESDSIASSSSASQLESEHERVGDPTTNPLLIELVARKVVSYLPVKDVLRCRLVNHLFNTICVGILKKKNRTIEITDSNVSQYMGLLQNPNIKITQLGLVSFSVYFGKSATKSAIKQLLGNVEKLIAVFGPECVQSIQLHSKPQYRDRETVDWIRLWKLIQSASAGLRQIIIDTAACIPPNCVTLMDPDFPQLTRLHFGGFTNNPTSACQLINASPKLLELALIQFDEEVEAVPNYSFPSQAVVTVLNGIGIGSMNNIKELRIEMGEMDTLNALGRFGFPKLESLILHLNKTMNEVMDECIEQLLVNKCPKLTSLEFVFHNWATEGLLFGENFSSLPNLKHFGYHAYPFYDCLYSGSTFLNVDRFSADKLPGLDSVSTQLGDCFFFCTDLLQDEDIPYDDGVNWYNNNNPQFVNDLQFPSVSTLNLELLDDYNHDDGRNGDGFFQACIRENVNQLGILYPNLTKLVITNQVEPQSWYSKYSNEKPRKALYAILKKMLPRIQEIEFYNYYEDWIGQVLKEVPAGAVMLSNLRKLTLHAVDKKWRCMPIRQFESSSGYNFSTRKKSFLKGPIFLQGLLQHFPTLQTLNIAEEFLTVDSHRLMSQGLTPAAREEIQNLKIAFPQLEIKLI